MKGVILAGGKGTRLYPLTKATNKHLLPIGREPMLYHLLRQMKSSDITNILVITSTEHMGDVVSCLGGGSQFGCELTYRVQEQPGGIAQALALAESFSEKQKICVALGDNIFEYSISPYVENYRQQEKGARVLLKEVDEPQHYGIAALDEKQIVEIQEKPTLPRSSYAVLGLYFYDPQVFNIIRTIQPSARGELEITSVNNAYIQRGELEYDVCMGQWTDAGTFHSYAEANKILFANNNQLLRHEEEVFS